MAKKAYIGVSGVAKKIKKCYVGVSGVARKVKKAYIGVGGVARPCWSGEEVVYYGEVTGLSAGRCRFSAAQAGNYAVFFGNEGGDAFYNLDAFNPSFTRTTLTPTGSHGGKNTAATSIGGSAMFYGGTSSLSSIPFYYTSSLVYKRASQSIFGSTRHEFTEGATAGSLAIFYGGSWYGHEDADETDMFECLNSSATWVRSGHTNIFTMRHVGVSFGDYALFAGGKGYEYWSDGEEDYYSDRGVFAVTIVVNSSGTYARCLNNLSPGAYNMAGTTVGDYAIVAGGTTNMSGTTRTNKAYAINKSLTTSAISNLSLARDQMTATSLGSHAIFAGGYTTSSQKTVDVYDSSLARSNTVSLATDRYEAASATTGKYALVAGGISGSSTLSSVEAFTV